MSAVNVKSIPNDLYKFVLKTQGNIKTDRGIGSYSQSNTIIHIIKEYKNLVDGKQGEQKES